VAQQAKQVYYCPYACQTEESLKGWYVVHTVSPHGRLPLLMRTSLCWTHRRYGLSQVAIRPQLSCHVTLGFSRHVVTVSVITLIRHRNGVFLDALERGRRRRRFGSDPSCRRSVDHSL
jgi:hypothetical protein